MSDPKKQYTKALKEAMLRKSEILSKVQAFWEIGMKETAQPLWLSAATYGAKGCGWTRSIQRYCLDLH